MASTCQLTMAQALIRFLKCQYVERDGVEHLFLSAASGIFGHGNVAGIGQALQHEAAVKRLFSLMSSRKLSKMRTGGNVLVQCLLGHRKAIW